MINNMPNNPGWPLQVRKAKAEYHNACKTERSYINQERNAAGDSTISPDTVRHLIF